MTNYLREYLTDNSKKDQLLPANVGLSTGGVDAMITQYNNLLLETTSGMDNAAILKYQLGVFRKTMDTYKKCKNQRIVFIHGKGEGVLRRALIDDLKLRYPLCTYQDASFQQYGFGATMITIH